MTEPLRLFLVEDDEDVALVISKCLERAGYIVTTCRTGADALIVLNHTDYSLMILDHQLPDMNGLDLLQTLSREGIKTPVLIITGGGDEELARQVLQAGAVDYVVKDSALTFLTDLPKRVCESVGRHRLQDTNRLLIQALESTRDGVLITNLQGEILHVNQSLEDLTGYHRRDMLGQTPRLFRSDMHRPEFFAELWRTILSGRSWQGELTNRRRDGTLFDVSLTVSPVFDGRNQMSHFVGIYHDIRDRKQLERQLLQAQKMQSVGTLAGGIAHEFNNLLAGIQGYAALGLREEELKPPAREFLQHIVELTDRAAALTRQLLAFARKPALSQQPTRLTDLLQSTADLVRHTVTLPVELRLPSEEPPALALADANQLQQVLVNLALNARDAIVAAAEQHGGLGQAPIVFGLRLVQLEGGLIAFPENVPPGDYVVLEVEDRGVGMSQEVLAQAFDPFFTTKGVGQGTGLGLPVAFGIVRGHQGFLTVATAPSAGTRVSIYLPRLLHQGNTDGRPVIEESDALEPANIIARNILVIDDEQAVLDVIRRFLEIAGHRVTCVPSGQQAVQELSGGLQPELVLLDLMIPHEEGAQNFRALRERRPGLPILLCTGLLPTTSPFAVLMDQAAGVLRKPFRMDALWHAVHRVFAPKD